MTFLTVLVAYAGPDTFLPLTSALSALVGAAMFLWSKGPRSLISSLGARLRRRGRTAAPSRGALRGPTPARKRVSDSVSK